MRSTARGVLKRITINGEPYLFKYDSDPDSERRVKLYKDLDKTQRGFLVLKLREMQEKYSDLPLSAEAKDFLGYYAPGNIQYGEPRDVKTADLRHT